jgi:hypothetical protein
MGNCNICSCQKGSESNPQNELISSREENNENGHQEQNEEIQKLSIHNMHNATFSRSGDHEFLNSDGENFKSRNNKKLQSIANIRTLPIEEDFEDFEFDDRNYSLDVFRFYNSFRTNPIDYINELFTEKYIDAKQIAYCDKVIDDLLYKSNKGNMSTNFFELNGNKNDSSNVEKEKNKGTLLISNHNFMSKVVWSNKLYFLLSDYLHEAERGAKFDTNYVEEKIKENFGEGSFVYISTLRIDKKIPPGETFNLILRDKIEKKNFVQFLNNEISFGAVSTIQFKESFYDTILCLLII